MPRRRLHLVCNAHLDPVWLWEWEEGASEALSTFRTAADLCEEFGEFVFNHNEVILYQWVEQYEPGLFRRIQRLVRQGKWHIMGGWFLQPDCNMPAGESFVRQIAVGRRYFREKFGVEPKTAINFDSFGHTRGLVQILAKTGYDSYLFCRPQVKWLSLPDHEFVWEGFDGSRVLACRTIDWYNNQLGHAREKIERRLADWPARDEMLMLWGVGNHGGGPSRKDLRDLRDLIRRTGDVEVRHSTPEAYFAEVRRRRDALPRWNRDLNPWGVGCYSSMIRVKQAHRRLENELYAAEKIAATAAAQGLMEYPGEELSQAQWDLLLAQFHDILPGSSIQSAEDTSLRLMSHGLEILSRVKARSFFALASGQKRAAPDEVPVLVHNPHPFTVRTIVELELQLADPAWRAPSVRPVACADGRALPTQVERVAGNVAMDWRKKIAFEAELAPASVSRFDCKLTAMQRPAGGPRRRNGKIVFRNGQMEAVVNTRTGLLDRYRVGGRDVLRKGALLPLVIADDENPWGSTVRAFRKVAGRFRLMSAGRAAEFCAFRGGRLEAVRVIEDGPVRSVVEALLQYGRSAMVLRYTLPRRGTWIGLDVRVFWFESCRMLKLALPTAAGGRLLGQTAYGIHELPNNGDEAVAQKWLAVVNDEADLALTCINDGTYASSYGRGELRLTLLRSPGYAAMGSTNRAAMAQDRFSPHHDQGERAFRFWLDAGKVRDRLDAIDREALVRNETPFALCLFPPGGGARPRPGPCLSDSATQVAAFKRADNGKGWIVRLFEPTGRKRSTVLTIPCLGVRRRLTLAPFEIKTLRIEPGTRRLTETDLLERPLRR